MSRVKNTNTVAKPKQFKETFKQLFNRVEGKKSIIIISIVFTFIGISLFLFASIAFGQVIQFFFVPFSSWDQNGVANTDFLKILTGGYAWYEWQAFAISISIIFICYIFYCFAQTFQNIIMIKIAQKTSSTLRKQVFDKLQKMPISYFDKHQSGDLMSRMTNDIDAISQGLTQSLSQFIQSVITIIVSFIIMMIMSSFISLIAIVLLFVLLTINIFFIFKAQPYFFKQQEKIGDLNGYIEEMISGQRMANLLNRQEVVSNRFNQLNNDIVKTSVISQTYGGFLFPWFTFSSNIVLLVVSCLAVAFAINNIIPGGVGGFDGKNEINLAFLGTFPLLVRNLINPMGQLLSTFNVVQQGVAGAERVFEILKLDEPIENPKAKELTNVKGHVEFKNVNFGYNQDVLNLKNANIDAKPGQVIAIVGPTGAGKTTIINLLTRFYNYNSGQILIDNNEINDIKEKSWRSNISIVLQDTYLFTDSIKENIRFGNLEATDQEVIEAAKIANAHHFITQFENGYDTILTSNGKDLSQGQRQLLAIARAVISKANILILDEATSSVDTRTEVHIQNAMLKLMKGRTSFVIAHRLSTIKNADQILVVNNGEIIEKGNHKSLLKIKNGFYANLYNSQFKNGVISDE